MMDLEAFYLRIDELNTRVARLRDGGGSDLGSDLALDESLEEMRVACEELRQQHEELHEAVYALEAERQVGWELFELAPEGYLITDPAGLIREANQAAVAALARPGGRLMGVPLANLVAEPDRRAFRVALVRLIGDGRPLTWSGRFESRSAGAPFDVECTAAVVRGPSGRPTAVRWLFRDVTEHRRAEEQRRQALYDHVVAVEDELAGYRDLVDGIDAIIWTADGVTGRMTSINRRTEELLGYPVRRWLDEPEFWDSLVHPDDREWAAAHRRRAAAAQDPPRELEYRLLAADGRVLWFRESIRPRHDAEGRLVSFVGVLWNISRRKKVERQLYAAKREMAAALADLSYLRDLSGRLVATPDLKPLLGAVLDGVLGVLGAESGIIRVYDPQRDELAAMAARGLPDSYLEHYARLRFPASGPTRAAMHPEPIVIEDAEAEGAPACARDAGRAGGFRAAYSVPLVGRAGTLLSTVTACFATPHRPSARQAELVGLFTRHAADLVQNARLFEQARDAAQTKDDFLALLAHELRNPLAAILNTVQALDCERPAAADITHACGVVERQARHMSRLVTDLLDAARAGHVGLVLHRAPVDLAAAVTAAVETTRALIELRRHTLEVHLPDGPVWTEGDADRLRQLVENLLGNAAKYTEPGGRITLAVEPGADAVRLGVRDTGIGISPELQPRIFEPYTQADPSPGGSQGGLGIGLALVRTIVEEHGGQIAVASAGARQGSTFTVTLPRGNPPAASAPGAPRAASPGPEAPARPLRVLIVDDIGDSLRRLLRRWGHDVRVAGDGPEALGLAAGFGPEVALIDLGLPGMDGYELARLLPRVAPGPCTLVAATGYGSDDDLRRAAEAGFTHYLVKPADPDDLSALLERIGQGRASEEGSGGPGT
jgi:PAS domain S-box-containing protein